MKQAAVVRLGQIMPPRLGSVDPSLFPDEEFELYSIPAFDVGAPELIPGSAIGSAKQVVRPGDVLLSRIVPHIRRAWVVGPERGRRIIASGEWIVFRGAGVEPSYLRHLLVGDAFHAEFMRTVSGVGGSLLRARPAYVAEIEVPLPSVEEQQRIAAILDQADALRAKRRAALAHLDALAQSIFLDMFGDPAANPMGWPRRSLADVFEIARGGSPRPIDDFITESPDGINWVMIGDASEGGGKYINRTRKRIKPEGARRSRAVKPGDFLLTNSMSFGRPYIMKTSGCIHDGWLVLSPRDGTFVPEYYYRLLGSSAVYAEFARLAPGATVKNLNINLVRSVEVPVAPTDRQLEFARRAEALERVRDSSLMSLTALNEQFLALQRQAFADGALAPVEAR